MILRNNKIGVFCRTADTATQAGDLPIVAVAQFESTVDNEGYFRTESNPTMRRCLTQLIKVGRFTVYERNKLDRVLGEQGLQQNLSYNGTQLQIDGVDYLVYGSITKKSTQKKQMNAGQFNSVSVVSTFGVDIKIVDATFEIRRAEAIGPVSAGQGVVAGTFVLQKVWVAAGRGPAISRKSLLRLC